MGASVVLIRHWTRLKWIASTPRRPHSALTGDQLTTLTTGKAALHEITRTARGVYLGTVTYCSGVPEPERGKN